MPQGSSAVRPTNGLYLLPFTSGGTITLHLVRRGETTILYLYSVT